MVLAGTGVAAFIGGAAAGTAGLIKGFLTNYASYDGMITPTVNGVTSPITPNSEHYVVTQNVVDPTPDINLWRLEVTGLVGHAGTHIYEEVQILPSTSRAVTLESISNCPPGLLIITSTWPGLILRTLLESPVGTET